LLPRTITTAITKITIPVINPASRLL